MRCISTNHINQSISLANVSLLMAVGRPRARNSPIFCTPNFTHLSFLLTFRLPRRTSVPSCIIQPRRRQSIRVPHPPCRPRPLQLATSSSVADRHAVIYIRPHISQKTVNSAANIITTSSSRPKHTNHTTTSPSICEMATATSYQFLFNTTISIDTNKNQRQPTFRLEKSSLVILS